MDARKKIVKGLKGLKRLSRRFEEIDVAEQISSILDLNPTNISNETESKQNEEGSRNSGVDSEVQNQNTKDPIYSDIINDNNNTRHEETISPVSLPAVQKNHWDIFGSPMYMENDFCVEAINTCEETVLFKICLNRYPIPNDNHIIIQEGSALPKAQSMIIRELIDTEETYLQKMKYAIDNYLQHFRDQNVSSNIELIFGNIEEIYSETEKIYTSMKTYSSVDDIAKVFLDNVSAFDCYTKYLRNQMNLQQYPIKEFDDLINQRQAELEDLYTCSSYLVNPAQRPGRYKLLLENLERVLEKNNESSTLLEEAVILVDTKISEANTLMAIDSIQQCPIDLYSAGRFLIKDTFNITGKYRSVIFLFEKYVLFCKDTEDNPNIYTYIDSIEMESLTLVSTNNSMKFQLGRFEKSKKVDGSEFEIESPLMVIKTKWVDEITRILWNQLQYCKEHPTNSNIQREDSIDIDQPHAESDREDERSLSELTPTEDNISLYDEQPTMAHTYFDKDKIARIEISRSDSLRSRDVYMEGRPDTILTELIQSEEAYLREMQYIIDEKVSFGTVNSPLCAQTLLDIVKNIFSATEMLHLKLLECESEEGVSKVFLDSAHIFDFYIEYMRAQAMSHRQPIVKIDTPVKDKEVKVNEQYTIDSYLLNPVLIRLGKYKTMLEKLQKEQAGLGKYFQSLDDAVRLINDKITEANTLMTVDSIQECPFDLKKMGPFIKKASFKLKRKHRRVVLLFREVVLICAEDKILSDTYIYVDSIAMGHLTFTHNRKTLSFELIDSNRSQSGKEKGSSFIFEADTKTAKDKWLSELETLLWAYVQNRKSFIGPQ